MTRKRLEIEERCSIGQIGSHKVKVKPLGVSKTLKILKSNISKTVRDREMVSIEVK